MIAFQRILFPVDLSKQSREAAPFVAAMATRFESQVFLLHVQEPHVSYYPVPAAATPVALNEEKASRAREQQEFDSLAADLFNGIPVRAQTRDGDPAAEIVSFAEANRIDLIMMPTHGYGRFRRLLLGSVTAKILHDVACPVWTGVHTQEMWSTTGAGWRRFLCAIDENPRDIPLLKWAAEFASEQNAELKVIHAVHPAAPIPAGDESESLREFLFGVARERLSEMQRKAGTNFDISLQIGPVWCVVRDAALQHRSDLILIGRGAIQKGFGRLRSNAYSVIREAPCPVMSI